jgi:signal recognition particle receptor subunit beta
MEGSIRLLVVGPATAGKTQFIEAVNELSPVWGDNGEPDYEARFPMPDVHFGRLTITEDSLRLYFIKFHPWLPLFTSEQFRDLTPELDGVLIVFDSSQPDSFSEVELILSYTRSNRLVPYFVIANKQEKPDALRVEDCRAALRLAPDEIIVPCNATNKDSVKTVLVYFARQFLDKSIADQMINKLQSM